MGRIHLTSAPGDHGQWRGQRQRQQRRKQQRKGWQKVISVQVTLPFAAITLQITNSPLSVRFAIVQVQVGFSLTRIPLTFALFRRGKRWLTQTQQKVQTSLADAHFQVGRSQEKVQAILTIWHTRITQVQEKLQRQKVRPAPGRQP